MYFLNIPFQKSVFQNQIHFQMETTGLEPDLASNSQLEALSYMLIQSTESKQSKSSQQSSFRLCKIPKE